MASVAESIPLEAATPLSLRERAFILGGIGGMTGIAWGKLAIIGAKAHAGGAGAFDGLLVLESTARAGAQNIGDSGALRLFATTALAVVALMLPASTPLALRVARVAKSRWPKREALPRVIAVIVGFLAVWLLASLPLGLAAWELERLGGEFARQPNFSAILGGSALLLAGLYQFTPLKQASLARCHSYEATLLPWTDGSFSGGLRVGARMGRRCAICDWALASLILVGGLAHPAWIGALLFFVVTEKIASPEGDFSRWAGLMMALGGMAVLFGATF